MTDQQIRERCEAFILSIFHAIKHGDSAHQSWLLDALKICPVESLYREAMAAGLERAAYLTENDVSLDIKFREKCATAIRREAQRVKEIAHENSRV